MAIGIGKGKAIAVGGILVFMVVGGLAFFSQWPFQDYSVAQKTWVFAWVIYGLLALSRFLLVTRSTNSVSRGKYWLGVLEGSPELLLSVALTLVAGNGYLNLKLDSLETYIGVGISIVVTMLNAYKR